MANVTIQGASYEDVPYIVLPKTGGGTEEFFWGGADLHWLGDNVEFLGEKYSEEYTLDDTDFNGWTPSTTAKAIIASKNVSPVVALDLATYEYAIRWKFDCDLVYGSSATTKARTERVVMDIWQTCSKRANSLANISAENPAGNACVTLTSAAILDYYNASSSHTYTWSASYGIYAAATAATFSSSTSNSPNLTIKTPSVSARCSTSYFSTANAALVDQANSTIKLKGYLYRYRKGGILYNEYQNLCNLYANPL